MSGFLVFFLYLLSWSEVLVPLTPTTTMILLLFLSVMLLIGISKKKKLDKFVSEKRKIPYFKIDTMIFVFTILLWVLQFAFFHEIPLISVILGKGVDYQEFGIPSLKVFIYSFSLFISTFYFHLYLDYKNKKHLIFSLLILFQPLLALSRGPFIVGLVQVFFVYCIYKDLFNTLISYFIKINIRKVFKVFTLAFSLSFIIFGFGYLGNLRNLSTDSARNNTSSFDADISSTQILMRPTTKFTQTGIPNEFLWTYVYITSPLSNFEFVLQRYQPKYDFSAFLLNEVLFDFISKRINHTFGADNRDSFLFVDYLTVSTVFAGSYQSMGYVGILMMCILLLTLPGIYLRFMLSINSTFYLTSLSIISALYLFMFFENLIVFSGLSLQLIYPFLFKLVLKKKTVKSHNY